MITADSITDEQIRDYVRDHWRDKWMDGGPGKGSVNDAAIILFSSTTSYEGAQRIRAEFARLVNACAWQCPSDVIGCTEDRCRHVAPPVVPL